MAETQTTAVLNLGSQRVSMAVFETSKTGVIVLKGFEASELPGDPLLDTARESQVESILTDLLSKLQLSKSNVRYAISGQTIFVRFVKLPPIEGDSLEQIVTFEAQQHVPFPIDEVIWDYELLDGGDEKEVIIVAIKGDALDEVDATVQNAGLNTTEVDVAPMALYNAFIASYGKPAESTLLIDVGARTSNLLFIEGERFFTRSIAIGGASVTAAIAKEFGVSFLEAEKQKKMNGLVALAGGHTDDLEEAQAALAMCIRNAMTRLPAEITRTTNYYRSQHGGTAPMRVLLAGGGANLPYTLEFFKEKLNLPIEFFNPLQHIAVGSGADSERVAGEAHMMGELVGLGLRSVGQSRINIDLVPQAVGVTRAAEKRKPFFVVAAVLLTIGLAIWSAFNYMAASKAEDELRTMTEVHDQLRPFGREISGFLKKQTALTKVAKGYTDMEKSHAYWFDVLSEINGTFADDSMWLTELVPMYDFKPFETGSSVKMEPAIDGNFAQSKEGGSSVKSPPKPPEIKTNRRRVEKPEPTKIGSVMLSGFWRENQKSQNIVSEALAKLRVNTKAFDFQITDGNGIFRTLTDEEILQVSFSGEKGDLGFPFQIILQLKDKTAAK